MNDSLRSASLEEVNRFLSQNKRLYISFSHVLLETSASRVPCATVLVLAQFPTTWSGHDVFLFSPVFTEKLIREEMVLYDGLTNTVPVS